MTLRGSVETIGLVDLLQLIQGNGHTGTLKVVGRTFPASAFSVAAQAALKKIDVEVELQETDPSQLLSERAKGNYVRHRPLMLQQLDLGKRSPFREQKEN